MYQFRNNTYTCHACGGMMAGDFTSHDHPHAHCMNQHCPEFRVRHRLPDNTHNPPLEHHVKPVGTPAPASEKEANEPTEVS
jgi:hypothetical protein